MSFVAVLKCGATPEVEAENFVKELLQRSASAGELCRTLTVKFINDIFKAIGFSCAIAESQLEVGDDFVWPISWRSYVFRCNTLFFSAFERFLRHICCTVRTEQQAFAAMQLDDEMGEECPLEWLLQLLTIWSNVGDKLLQLERNMPAQYFEEPLARINYQLYCGLHELRKEHGRPHPLMDRICQRFFYNALQGLFYKACHNQIAEGVLSLVESDFGCCTAFAEDVLVFFYEAFSVEQRTTHCRLYKCAMRVLSELEANSNEQLHRRLLNFCMSSRMQSVYYTTLKLDKTKTTLIAALEFLNVLQNQLLDLDRFSQPFIESVLANVLHSDQNVSLLAAELYVVMTRRKLNNDLLLKHILEYYFKKLNSPANLSSYVIALWPHFPYMQSMTVYAELLQNTNIEKPMLCLIAHFAVACYKEMLKHLEKYEQQIVYMLQHLPSLSKQLKDETMKGILLQVLASTELDLLDGSTTNLFLLDFENYALAEFQHSKNISYTYISNLFAQILRCVEHTKNFSKMEMCAVYVQQQYEELEHCLQQLKDPTKPPKTAHLRRYNDVLQKLCALLKAKYNILDCLEQLLQTLNARLIDKQQFVTFIGNNTPLIDAYAVEAIVSCCIKLAVADDQLSARKKLLIATQVRAMELYLLGCLSNLNVATSADLVRLKTHFSALITLYLAFPPKSHICNLRLQLRPYQALVQALILGCLEVKKLPLKPNSAEDYQLESHPQRIYEYQLLMFKKFTQLHACKHVTIPSGISWKLCINYGLTPHKFNAELAAFMHTLAMHHLKIYTHVTAVLVYNLYKRQPPFKENSILAAIRLHKAFIDKLPSSRSPAIVNASVVLQVLELLQHSLRMLPPTTGGNRLALLKYLHNFTENLNVNDGNVLRDVLTHAKALQSHMLNGVEQMRLSGYIYNLLKRKRTINTNNPAE